jgi:hypothetical protein
MNAAYWICKHPGRSLNTNTIPNPRESRLKYYFAHIRNVPDASSYTLLFDHVPPWKSSLNSEWGNF